MGDIRDERGLAMPVPGNGRNKRARVDADGNIGQENLYFYPSDVRTAPRVNLRTMLTTSTTLTTTAPAIPLTSGQVLLDGTGNNVAATLANGLYTGQQIRIGCVADGSNTITVTPAAPGFLGATAVVTLTTGEAITVEWTNATHGWMIVGTSAANTLIPAYS
jgi:hypothetical protein